MKIYILGFTLLFYLSEANVTYCKDYQSLTQKTFYSTKKEKLDNYLYVVIMVPPFMGSSALENLLLTSPHVSSMCQKTSWQCESTWNLIDANIFKRSERWVPEATDWYKVYEYFENTKIWDDMEKPIRIDKAPPNIVKYKQLMAYFEDTKKNYIFVAMKPDRCRVSRHQYTLNGVDQRLRQMQALEDYVPSHRLLKLNYTNMITNTKFFIRKILNKIPSLERLDIKSVKIHERQLQNDNFREKSLYNFIYSNHCKIQNYC